jgi:hypothetical protein
LQIPDKKMIPAINQRINPLENIKINSKMND